MNYDMVMELLESADDDFILEIDYDGSILVCLNNVEGFDKETGEEIYHELKNEKLVHSIVEQLKQSALSIEKDNVCCRYEFDSFTVVWYF